MIHKKILDRAEEDPSLSIQALADDIAGASAELIEAVLEEYGDPGDEDPDGAAGDAELTGSNADSYFPDAADATKPTHPGHSNSSASPDGGAESPEASQTKNAEVDPNEPVAMSTFSGAATDQGEDGTQLHTEHADERSPDPARIDGREESDGQSSTQPVDLPATATKDSPEVGSEAEPVADTTSDTHLSASSAESSGPSQDEQTDTTESRTGHADNDGSDDNEQVAPSLSDFSPQQQRTLTAIRKRPQATQDKIADELGVSRATVSLRAKAIPGLEWRAREQFITELFDQADSNSDDGHTAVPSTQPSRAEELATREQKDDDKRQNVPPDQGGAEITRHADSPSSPRSNKDSSDARKQTSPAASLRHHPELLHKVLRCCMDADDFSKEEERQLVACLVGAGR